VEFILMQECLEKSNTHKQSCHDLASRNSLPAIHHPSPTAVAIVALTMLMQVSCRDVG
jgi:hypothetical protein